MSKYQPSKKSGELLKKSHGFISFTWNERHVDLDGTSLKYYKDAARKSLAGELLLKDCEIVDKGTEVDTLSPMGMEKGWVFMITSTSGNSKTGKNANEKFYFWCPGDKDIWVSAIRHNILLLNNGYAWQREEAEKAAKGGGGVVVEEENLGKKLQKILKVYGNHFVISDFLSLNKGENCLEIGSGNGYKLLECFLRVGEEGHVTGLEWSSDLIRDANALLKECEGKVEVIGCSDCSAAALKALSTAAYNKILVHNVLYLYLWTECDPKNIVSQLFRLLNTGGRLVVAIPYATENESTKTENNGQY